MEMASQAAAIFTGDRGRGLAAVDALGRLAQARSWGSLTTSIHSVDVVDGMTRMELTDRANSSSYIDLGLTPDRSSVRGRLPESLSVIISHRVRSIDCVLVRLHGRSDKISFAEALGFLEHGVHGVVRWETRTDRDAPTRRASSD